MSRGVYITILVILYFSGCEVQDVNRPGDKLDGIITFTDSNLIFTGGCPTVSVYSADSTYPFHRVPIRTDSLKVIYRMNNYKVAEYSMDGIPPGNILVASTWSRHPRRSTDVPIVLGTYGCDTSRSCTQHGIVIYPNTQGNFRNILSWTDTTRRLN